MSRRLHIPVVLVAVILLSGLLVPGAAEAAVAPAAPVFPRQIDGYASHEAETGCDPTVKPGAAEIVRVLRATYGDRPGTNVARDCTASSSGHEEGRAVDWMTNARDWYQRDLAESFIGWLLATDQYGNTHAMARRLGVSYLIWDSRKLYLWDTGAGWTQYSDCLTVRTGPEHDNICHRNHVHLSLSWAGANATTSWYTKAGQARGICFTPPPVSASPATGSAGLGYVPITPSRLLDTRSGYQHPEGCLLGQNGRADVQVTGRGGVPLSGVAAAVLNLTAVQPRGFTWLSAYPAGTGFPGTSAVNVSPGAVTAGLVVVPIGGSGKISVLNGGSLTDVLVDVVGYYPTDGSGSRYTPTAPSRILDALRPASSYIQVAAGPATAVGAVVNATLDSPAAPGFASLLPQAVPGQPSTSTVNGSHGEASANRAFTRLADGGLTVYNGTTARTVIDVSGYFGTTGAAYRPLTPTRVVDTRSSLGGVPRIIGSEPVTVQLGGRAGVPADATAVAITLVGVDSALPAYLRVWQPGTPMPTTSDLNLKAYEPRANMVIAPLDATGRTTLMVSQGSADVLIDVLGYYR